MVLRGVRVWISIIGSAWDHRAPRSERPTCATATAALQLRSSAITSGYRADYHTPPATWTRRARRFPSARSARKTGASGDRQGGRRPRAHCSMAWSFHRPSTMRERHARIVTLILAQDPRIEVLVVDTIPYGTANGRQLSAPIRPFHVCTGRQGRAGSRRIPWALGRIRYISDGRGLSHDPSTSESLRRAGRRPGLGRATVMAGHRRDWR